MPRNGSDIYSIPPGTEGFPDTTIESEKYNIFIHDVETDLNTPRPIVAGGTGSSTADGALAEIGGEKASQVVTNYDSHPWMPGSFYSAASATSPPVAGHAFTGWITSSDPPADPPTNLNVVVHARDQNDTIVPGRLYVREKKAGVWGLWKLDGVSLYVADTPPVDAPDKSLWWESDSGLLYVRYNDGAGTPQWVIACPQPDISVFALKTEVAAADALLAPINSPTFTGDPKAPTPTAGDSDTSIATTGFVSDAISTAVGGIPGAPSAVVRYDIAQTLTAPQLVQARQNIYAAPFDALAYNGMQVNGSVEVAQEGLSFAGLINITRYGPDGWQVATAGTQNITIAQNGNIVLAGFNAGLQISVQTANAAPAAGDYCVIRQPIEGYRVRRLAWGTANAQPITIGFWVANSRTGNYSGCVRNNAGNRFYPFSFTINAAGVWEYKTVTIPGDTTGTWENGNLAGLYVQFALMLGSTFQGPANAWSSSAYLGVTGTVNGVAATSDYFTVTGVTVLPGTEAPSAARSPFIMRPFDQELVTCQRYYRKIGGGATNEFVLGGYSLASSGIYTTLSVTPTMRASPTASVFGAGFSATNSSAPTFIAGPTTLVVGINSGAAGYMQIASVAGGGISLDARL